jgi:DNA-binding CsgD family transcriptional regulator
LPALVTPGTGNLRSLSAPHSCTYWGALPHHPRLIPAPGGALTAVTQGGLYYCSTAKKLLFNTLQTNSKKEKKIPFSVQEMKAIQLICKQLTTKEIAGTLRLGNRSVEDYRKNIQEKKGARNMVGIALYALANDLIKLSELDLF